MDSDYRYEPTPDELRQIRTTPGRTASGTPFQDYTDKQVTEGRWRLECVRADVLGLSRPLEIYRAARKTDLIKPWTRTDDGDSYCPAHWADLAIGRGACGLRCRACFLVMTHRVMADPSRHVVYENLKDYEGAVRSWLRTPDRRSLGLGIDCSDSLLYEGVTGHARRIIPLFASAETNPTDVKLVLLTKTANTHYLRGLPTHNILITFSLNPEPVADLWEGKFPDGTRVTPTVSRRLEAALEAQEMGFEVRWRVDPIFALDSWRDLYGAFFKEVAQVGHRPARITLGTYREMQPSLRTFVEKWGLPSMEVDQAGLVKEGHHYHLPAKQRAHIYETINEEISRAWHGAGHMPVVALCKEPKTLKQKVGLDHDCCNCGP